MNGRPWLLGLAHGIVWLVVVLSTQAVMNASPARAAYSVAFAWWATLYLALLLGTTWRAVPTFLAIMALALIVDAAVGSARLYHDSPAVLSVGFASLLLLLCALWVSPFLVNSIARGLRDRIVKS